MNVAKILVPYSVQLTDNSALLVRILLSCLFVFVVVCSFVLFVFKEKTIRRIEYTVQA